MRPRFDLPVFSDYSDRHPGRIPSGNGLVEGQPIDFAHSNQPY